MGAGVGEVDINSGSHLAGTPGSQEADPRDLLASTPSREDRRGTGRRAGCGLCPPPPLPWLGTLDGWGPLSAAPSPASHQLLPLRPGGEAGRRCNSGEER